MKTTLSLGFLLLTTGPLVSAAVEPRKSPCLYTSEFTKETVMSNHQQREILSNAGTECAEQRAILRPITDMEFPQG